MSDSVPVRLADLLAEREWVSRLARGIAPDAATADDVEQETWLAAVRRPPPSGHSVRGWLATVARNVVRQAKRGGTRRAGREEAVARRDRSPSTFDVVARAETQRRVADTVLGLPEPYRSTLLLRYFEGLPVAEIASRTDTPRETVKTRIARGHALLRDRLDDRHGGSRSAWLVPLLALSDRPANGSALLAKGILMTISARRVAVVAALILLSGVGAYLLGPEPRGKPPAEPDAEVAALPPEAGGAESPPEESVPDEPESSAPGGGAAAGSGTGVREEAKAPPSGVMRATVASAETGRPLSGARVAVFAGGREIASGATDRDGHASIPGIIGGFLGFIISAPRHATQRLSVVSEEGQQIEISLAMEKGRELTGRIVGPDRRPVAGASISAHGGVQMASLSPGTLLEAAKSDAEGRFVLTRMPGSYPVTLAARAVGFALGRRVVPPVETLAGGPVEVVLAPGGSVRGHVRLSDGAPVPGATVYLLADEESGGAEARGVDIWGGMPSEGSDVTGEDGAYLIPGLEFDRSYRIMARSPEGADSNELAVSVTKSGPVATRDLAVPDAAALRVVVLNEGLSEIAVKARRNEVSHPFRPDGSGAFVADDLAAGSYDVHVTAKDRMEHRRRVEARPGETTEVRVRLRRGETFSGLVVDTEGQPVPGVILTLSREDQAADAVDAPSAQGETDDQGRFHVADLARASYLVNFYAPVHEALVSRTVEVPAGDVTIVLRSDGAVTVALRTEGAPPPEQVHALVRSLESGGAVGRMLDWSSEPVRLDRVEAGDGEVVIAANGFGREVRGFRMTAGGEVDLGEIVLRPAVAAVGVVLDPDGDPAAGAVVESGERWMPDHVAVKADDSGRFRLEEVAAGSALITVSRDGLPAQVFTVPTGPGASPAVLRLRPRALLAGRLVDAAGKGVPNARIRLVRLDGGPSVPGAAVTDADGAFEKALPAGRWRLVVVRGAGGAAAEREIDLAPGEPEPIEWRIEAR